MIAPLNVSDEIAHCLGVFAKYWEPGKVKTRLAQSFGTTKAARIYEVFVAATIARLTSIEARRVLAYSPGDPATRQHFSAAEKEGWGLTAQVSGDLGQRMATFFEEQLRHGAERVVLVGTDSPNLPLVEVQEAFEHLRTTDVVIGPSRDGGYYLIGVAERVPPIFEDMPWSGPELLKATTSRLQAAGIAFETLDPWYDVDELFDLHQLIDDLRDEQDDPPLQVLLCQLLEVLEIG